ncbi:MAG: chorismate mutase [Bacteroidota bacterium]
MTHLMKDKTDIAQNPNHTKVPFIIAGPCSAESEEQLMATAVELAKEKRINALRAGIWKPRTKPGGFEGAGTKGLAWMAQAKKQTGLPIAVEVATSKHVEDSLHFDVDILWVGARTTVNPFSVQQLADAVKGTDVTVLIKNPINPDVNLWAGAVERFAKAGVTKIGLIHRGFSAYGKSEFRNVPLWQIPIELKRLFPELPMLCDPSHICGNTTLLPSTVQKSIDLDYDGLIIESHINPKEAWTDAAQQVSPSDLTDLLDSVIWKSNYADEESFRRELDSLREQINYFDEELISLINSRMLAAMKIGSLKKKNSITIFQNTRWSEILEKLTEKGKQFGFSEEFMHTYLEAIHLESIRLQNQVKE